MTVRVTASPFHVQVWRSGSIISAPRSSERAATSSAPSAEPWALPVFCLFGAGQPMIVRSTMKVGFSVTF